MGVFDAVPHDVVTELDDLDGADRSGFVCSHSVCCFGARPGVRPTGESQLFVPTIPSQRRRQPSGECDADQVRALQEREERDGDQGPRDRRIREGARRQPPQGRFADAPAPLPDAKDCAQSRSEFWTTMTPPGPRPRGRCRRDVALLFRQRGRCAAPPNRPPQHITQQPWPHR